ncbi:MAG: carboxypeptidase-like regulatory domain-containing protein [Bacteroidota bacterium]
MANDNTIKTFSAVDIERYHRGLLSASERHAMEKAALDDPFLADALEGYAVAGVNAAEDIAELKRRLADRTSNKKVIPISTVGKSKPFFWLRAAAIIIVIAGAGLITYRLAFNNRSNNIAEAKAKKTEQPISADSDQTVSSLTEPAKSADANTDKQKDINIKTKEQPAPVIITNLNNAGAARKVDSIGYSFNTETKNINPTQISPAGKKNLFTKNPDAKTGDAIAKQQLEEKITAPKETLEDAKQQRAESASPTNNDIVSGNRSFNQLRNNVFRGRITDAGNNPVPFANITNTEDNIGTYSDAKGYFNLVSPDSVLHVQVRSVGFENNSTQLRNSAGYNQVVLEEDRSNLAEVVISNKKPNAAARARDANVKFEEPEPADGWDNYDAYLANNLNVPDEIKTKQGTGAVEVSLEVDKNGMPINIKVEKSLCDKCDKEAIRLIKEGPKWKRKIRKGRATVTIPF